MRRQFLYYLSGWLLLIVAIGAVYAGVGFIVWTDGSFIGMSVDALKNSPFESYFIPGLVLLLVNGFGSLIGCHLAFARSPYTGLVLISLGVWMLLWIAAQVYWIGLQNPLQILFLLIGIVEILLGTVLLKKHLKNKVF